MSPWLGGAFWKARGHGTLTSRLTIALQATGCEARRRVRLRDGSSALDLRITQFDGKTYTLSPSAGEEGWCRAKTERLTSFALLRVNVRAGGEVGRRD